VGLTPKIRKAVIGATVAVTAATLSGVVIASAPSSSAATSCGVLFDDFSYGSRADTAFTSAGWSVRSNQGGPGVPGSNWSPDALTFPTVDGQRVAQMQASTNGAAGGTTNVEFSLSNRRFFEGTTYARIKFSDAPVSGTDGDIINQTFYSISPLAYQNDPTYSELDFSEYLPNGGWGAQSATNFETTYYTYQTTPEWKADNVHDQQTKSIAGWHDVMATVAGGHVKYYIDGALVGDHSGKFYPRQNMSIDFNQWFIDLTGHQGGGTSVWNESVDYVLHAKKQTLTPAQATAAVNAYRSSGTAHTDNVVAANDCDPGVPPTTPTNPPAGGTSQIIGFNNRCIDVSGGGAAPANGTPVIIYDCHGGANQKWEFAADGTLRSLGKCLDVTDANPNNGTLLQVTGCGTQAAQKFTLQSNGLLRTALAGGRCVDVKDRNPANAARLQLWDCNPGQDNQTWRKG
jgi:hypothetical protein